MNLTDYTYLLNKPDAITDRATDDLERIVYNFPYFQSARALRLKGLYNQNSFQYNYALKIAAAYTTDRSILFDFITSNSFTTIDRKIYDEKLAEINRIEVTDSLEVVPEPDEEKLERSILNSIREAETPAAILSPEIAVQAAEEKPAEQKPAEQKPAEQKTVEQKTVDLSEFSIPTFDRKENTEDNTEDNSKENSRDNLPESKLDLGKPLEFSSNEKHSFSEWLQLTRAQPIQRPQTQQVLPGPAEAPAPEDKKKLEKKDLIDRFIQASPKIPPVKSGVQAQPVRETAPDPTSLMTETLARVYLEQKKYIKAIQAYEILILKYPEKSSFFADRISEIKNLQQNPNL
jgi:hypothetical protein